jgi:hypothetical protein
MGNEGIVALATVLGCIMRNEADPRGSAKINSTVHIRYHDLSNKEQHIKTKIYVFSYPRDSLSIREAKRSFLGTRDLQCLRLTLLFYLMVSSNCSHYFQLMVRRVFHL